MQFKTGETILWKVLVRFSIDEYQRTMMFHRAPILMNKDCKTSGQRKLGTNRKWGRRRETHWRAPWCKGANTSVLVKTQSKLSYQSVIALVLWLCMRSIIGWLLYEWTMNKRDIFQTFFISSSSSVKLTEVVDDYQTHIEQALEGTGQKTLESVAEGNMSSQKPILLMGKYRRTQNAFWLLLLSTAWELQAECWPR